MHCTAGKSLHLLQPDTQHNVPASKLRWLGYSLKTERNWQLLTLPETKLLGLSLLTATSQVNTTSWEMHTTSLKVHMTGGKAGRDSCLSALTWSVLGTQKHQKKGDRGQLGSIGRASPLPINCAPLAANKVAATVQMISSAAGMTSRPKRAAPYARTPPVHAQTL